MLTGVRLFRQPLLKSAIVALLLLAAAPVATATAASATLHPVGPKQQYLALGDSLAFGYQPNGGLHAWVCS